MVIGYCRWRAGKDSESTVSACTGKWMPARSNNHWLWKVCLRHWRKCSYPSHNKLKTFGELSEIILKVLPKADTLNFVTDSYHINSRQLRQLNVQGVENVQSTSLMTKLPRDFASYLVISPVSCTKQRIRGNYCPFLLAHWQQPQFAPLLHGQRLFFVCEQQCTTLSSSDGVTVDVSAVPDLHSSQEEADTRIILHCTYIAQTAEPTKTHAVVRSPNTDVFVLLLHFSLDIGLHILFDTGTGNKWRTVNVNSTASAVGPEVSARIPCIHWMWLHKCLCQEREEETSDSDEK